MLYVIIVSHNHDQLLEEMLPKITLKNNGDVRIIVKDNVRSERLKYICARYGVDYIFSASPMGFGENNNFAVSNAIEKHNLCNDDYIVFLNPDVIIEFGELQKIEKFVVDNNIPVFTIDLFKDHGFTVRDGFIRSFPVFNDFVQSLFFKVNNTVINRCCIHNVVDIDWCAGSFIGFRAREFLMLNGFDEKYFMYCEDIDICYRAKLKGIKISYLPQFKAVHYAMHANRKIYSKAFRWHLASAIKFLFKKYRYKEIIKYSESTKSIFKN